MLGCEHPKIDENGWLELKHGEYIEFIIRVAWNAVRPQPIRMARDNQEAERTVIALQEAIALRAYVSKILGTVRITKSALNHQEILFVLIAFRALLMCTLPIQPKNSGVHQVAKILPQYAKELILLIQLTNEENEKLSTCTIKKNEKLSTCTIKKNEKLSTCTIKKNEKLSTCMFFLIILFCVVFVHLQYMYI